MRLIAILVSLLIFCPAALADEVSLLQLDTGGHLARIKGLAFTPGGKYIVSAGLDKVIRVWDWRAGKTVRTIRGRSGPGDDGNIYAMALSPDGRRLAVGGWFGRLDGTNLQECGAIRLYDFESGELKALLKGHEGAVFGIAFSSDGKKLISGGSFGDNTAIVWDAEHGTLLHKFQGHRAEIYAVAFSPDGERAVTGSFDETLRLWDVASGALLREMTGHGDKVRSLAVSPKDGAIASGDKSGEIRLWDGNTGELLKVLANQGAEVGALHFSPDGGSLLSAYGECASCRYAQHIWDVATGHRLAAYTSHDNVVVAAAFSADGGLVATGGGSANEIHVWEPKGAVEKAVLKGTGQPRRTVAFSADGLSIAWGSGMAQSDGTGSGQIETALRWPGADPFLARPERAASQDGWVTAQPELNGLSLVPRKGGIYRYNDAILDIVKDGKPTGTAIERGAAEGYRHLSYGFSPDGQQIVSGGGNGVLTAYGLDGTKLGSFVGHEGEVWSIAFSPDGRYLVSGSADQTLRLWNSKTRELLATLFSGADGEWVMWTPEGFYGGSKGGARLVGWQVNMGPDKAAGYVSADQLRADFLRPDLIAKKIGCAQEQREDAQKACASYWEQARRYQLNEVLASGAAPRVEIVSPAGSSQAEGAKIKVVARITDGGGGVGRMDWRINGQHVRSAFGPGVLDANREIAQTFELASTANKIEVTAGNTAGLVLSKTASVTVTASEKDLKGIPDLYVLAIGVNEYKDERIVLRYAVDDGKALGEALVEAGKDYYKRKPTFIHLTNDDVTAEKISAALKDLSARMRATDVFVFFVAGHGKNIDGDYHFVPRGADNLSEEAIKRQGFGPAHWRAWSELIKAQKTVWIFDTCDAGAVEGIFRHGIEDDTASIRMNSVTGRTTFMASSDQQEALEGYGKHGVMTYVLLEGLALAGNPGSKLVQLADLKTYVEVKVPEYSRALPSCKPTRSGGSCQNAHVTIPGYTFPLVRRYPAILAKLNPGARRIPAMPTDAVLPPGADVFSAAKSATGSSHRLEQGEMVAVIAVKDGWAEVAQDGKFIGYVRQNRLLKLKR